MMAFPTCFVLAFIPIFISLEPVSAFGKENFGTLGSHGPSETFRNEISLGAPNPMILKWTVNLAKKLISFNVTAPTNGYITLGLSRRTGPIDGIIGGVFSNGASYFHDMHMNENASFPFRLKEDKVQNWRLLKSFENSSITSISFTRKLDTCDNLDDVTINTDTLALHWGFDIGDVLYKSSSYTGGSVPIILLNPNPVLQSESFRHWDLLQTNEVTRGRTTSYWCTINKGPKLNKKHHLVSFTPYFEDDLAKKHVHHFVVYKCLSPSQSQSDKDYFEPYLKASGGECYESPEIVVPSRHCRSFLYVWAFGGKALTLPEATGIPIGEEEDEYYMLEVHYDNPETLPGLNITAGVKITFTDKLRPMDAGVFMMGNDVSATFTVPPQSDSFSIYGHCGSNCTWNNFPPEGINIFGALLHSHLKGREMRLHHYQQNSELDWVASDVNFYPSYQQTRLINNGGRRVLPGDHLMIRCTYNNSQSTGSTVGGFSTREEMCLGFIWYYPKIPMAQCTSDFPSKSLITDFFGIKKVTWRLGLIQPVILEPPQWANKTLSEFMDEDFEWTSENRERLQMMFRNGEYDEICSVPGKKTTFPSNIANPKLKEVYEEPNLCKGSL